MKSKNKDYVTYKDNITPMQGITKYISKMTNMRIILFAVVIAVLIALYSSLALHAQEAVEVEGTTEVAEAEMTTDAEGAAGEEAQEVVAGSEPLDEVPVKGAETRTFFGVSSRVIIWIIAEIHLMFGAFVLAVPMFAIAIEFVALKKSKTDPVEAARYDKLGKEFGKLLSAAFATTAALGGLLAFTLLSLYPVFMHDMIRIFNKGMFFYALLFFGETFTLYAWYYSWDRLLHTPGQRWLHISMNILLNLFGTVIMLAANAWATFMMSPDGINMVTGQVTSLYHAIWNPLWVPVAVHRLLGNLTFGGFIVGGYAAIKLLKSYTPEERRHYDWMGYTGNYVGLIGLIPLPFAGYWLGREVYSASAVMGNQMMGGAFSWPFVVQITMVSTIFTLANYYIWMSMQRMPGIERYNYMLKYVFAVIAVCFAILITPHNLPLSGEERAIIGEAYHPFSKFFGVMTGKVAVFNFMILTTFFTFLIYRRANKSETVHFSTHGKNAKIVILSTAGVVSGLMALYAIALVTDEANAKVIGYVWPLAGLLFFEIASMWISSFLTFANRGKLAQYINYGVTVFTVVLFLGFYGFYVMSTANLVMRYITVTQVIMVLSCMAMNAVIDAYLYRNARVIGEIKWGKIPLRAQYVLILLCVAIVILIGVMGFIRSGLRMEWHIYGYMQDPTAYAFTPSVRMLGVVNGSIVAIFLSMVVLVFWLAGLTEKKKVVAPDEAKRKVPGIPPD
ncbi:MAG: subunit 1 of alternative cytochrome bd quinol oxidase (CydA) [Candidatus Scalindua rubra]|uniref:Subunit 1 of alternative cytochrome bd quinol oxidase (CydA) n=1 Tax=Candidatus Scalindua rubra TaxID=1872076 RepID=A0A1E3X4P8_9BACT|nr:MAG: subunit 1 of alternative cytochrome bd quinol oxidase (CydA) [Candidatus Scalindua rubra]